MVRKLASVALLVQPVGTHVVGVLPTPHTHTQLVQSKALGDSRPSHPPCLRTLQLTLAIFVACVLAVLAYFVAAMSPNMDVANAALPVYVSTLLFFTGFLFT